MNPPPVSYGQPAAPKSKNKWVVFGCGGCLVLILLGLGIGGAIFYGALSVVKSSAPYQTALTGAQNSPEVQAELGTPITAGFLLTGKVSAENGAGAAEFTIPISGPKGAGNVHYKAANDGSKWTVEDFKVTITGDGKVIDLAH